MSRTPLIVTVMKNALNVTKLLVSHRNLDPNKPLYVSLLPPGLCYSTSNTVRFIGRKDRTSLSLRKRKRCNGRTSLLCPRNQCAHERHGKVNTSSLISNSFFFQKGITPRKAAKRAMKKGHLTTEGYEEICTFLEGVDGESCSTTLLYTLTERCFVSSEEPPAKTSRRRLFGTHGSACHIPHGEQEIEGGLKSGNPQKALL